MFERAVVPRPLSRRTAVEFALLTLIWGSTWLVIKGQLGDVPAAWSIAYRFLIAGGLMFAFCVATGRWQRLNGRAHGFALVAGAFQFVGNFNLVYAAETYLTSGLVALVFALLIVPNAVFARAFLGVPVTPRFVVGSGIGLAGLALVFAPEVGAAGGAPGAAAWGVLLAAGAVLSASVANVMQAGPLARSLPALPTLALTMVYGGLLNTGLALVSEGPPVFDPRPEYWLGLVYLAVVASVVAFTLYYGLIRRIGAGPAAYSSVIVPVVAMALSTAFEAYVWTPVAAAGAALAMAGLVVALGSRPRAVSEAAA